MRFHFHPTLPHFRGVGPGIRLFIQRQYSHRELFALRDAHGNTAAGGTFEGPVGGLEDMPAGPASHLARNAVEMQYRSMGNRPVGDHIPVELDRVIHDGGNCPMIRLISVILAALASSACRRQISRNVFG